MLFHVVGYGVHMRQDSEGELLHGYYLPPEPVEEHLRPFLNPPPPCLIFRYCPNIFHPRHTSCGSAPTMDRCRCRPPCLCTCWFSCLGCPFCRKCSLILRALPNMRCPGKFPPSLLGEDESLPLWILVHFLSFKMPSIVSYTID